MKINKKNFIIFSLFILLLISMFYYIFSSIDIINKNFEVILTFIILMIIILTGIFREKRTFTLNKTYWYFMLFFMFIAPLIQYLTNYSEWGYLINDNLYISINVLLILFNLLYGVTYFIFNSKQKKIEYSNKKEDITLNKKVLNILFLLSIISYLVLIKIIGFKNLFIRTSNDFGVEDSALNTILNNFMRAIPVYFSVYSILYYKENKKGITYVIISLIITFLMNYPPALTRYWIGAIYIGIILVLIKEKLNSRTFDIFIVLVFLLIFPMFQFFKYNTLKDIRSDNLPLNSIQGIYDNPDFDAYSMFARAKIYTKSNGVTLGKQLLGTILFIIPRKVWVNKPIPSGELIATNQNQSFTNLSCPFPAEGLINFGIFGVIIYSIILGLLLSYLDNEYWKENQNKRFLIIYPFLIGFLIFILRGSFHPAIVFMFTFYLPMIVFDIFTKIFKKEKYIRE